MLQLPRDQCQTRLHTEKLLHDYLVSTRQQKRIKSLLLSCSTQCERRILEVGTRIEARLGLSNEAHAKRDHGAITIS